MTHNPFSIKERLKSFQYAFAGLKTLLLHEHNSRIHLAAALTVITLGFILKISATEWILIVFAIGIVFAAEAFNSAIEYLANYVSPQYHELIKKVKDLSALAVLFLAAASLIAGLIIFIPKLIALW
jgi:diacylglycerol kinase